MDCFFCSLPHFLTMLPKRFSISTLSFHCKQPLVLQVLCISVIEDTLLVRKEDLSSSCIFYPLSTVSIICWHMSRVGQLPEGTDVKVWDHYQTSRLLRERAVTVCHKPLWLWMMHSYMVCDIYVTMWQRQKSQFAKCNQDTHHTHKNTILHLGLSGNKVCLYKTERAILKGHYNRIFKLS